MRPIKFKYTNELGETSRNKIDTYVFYGFVYANKINVSPKWKIEFSLGNIPAMLNRGAKTKIKRGHSKKVKVKLIPPPNARRVPYTLIVYISHQNRPMRAKDALRFAERKEFKFHLGMDNIKGFDKIPKEIQDLKEAHNIKDNIAYLSTFLFETKRLKLDEFEDIKRKIDAVYNLLPQQKKAQLQKTYTTLCQWHDKVLRDPLAHQESIKKAIQTIQAQVGKWAFKRDKKGEPIGLEPLTWQDPTYLQKAQPLLKRANDIRQGILTYLQYCEQIYNAFTQKEQGPKKKAPVKKLAKSLNK